MRLAQTLAGEEKDFGESRAPSLALGAAVGAHGQPGWGRLLLLLLQPQRWLGDLRREGPGGQCQGGSHRKPVCRPRGECGQGVRTQVHRGSCKAFALQLSGRLCSPETSLLSKEQLPSPFSQRPPELPVLEPMLETPGVGAERKWLSVVGCAWADLEGP